MSVNFIVSYSVISSSYAKWNSWTGNMDRVLIFPIEIAVTSCLAKVRLSVHMFYCPYMHFSVYVGVSFPLNNVLY